MADIAELGIRVQSDGVATATSRMGELERQSGRTETATDRLVRTAGRLAAQLVALAAVSFSFNAMIGQARAFDAALAEVSTLLPVVEGEIDAITEASRRMSREFGTTAASQAQAFYQAISAGAGNAAEATELLEVANRTAIGGVTDVTVAVDILTTATNAYAAQNLTASDAADTLFVGMRAGKTTIDELASTLGRVIPQATAVGFAFDEIVAATSALTTQGQSTEMAVTGLSGIMTQLLRPSSQAVELANQLGIEFSATAARTMGLAEFMEYLVEATDGSQEALATLFGSTEALRAVFSLAGQGGVQFAEILEDMEVRAGAADEAFARVSESLDQRLNVAFAQIGDVALGMGMTLLEVVVPAVEAGAAAAVLLSDNLERVIYYATALGTILALNYAASVITATGVTAALTAGLGLLRAALIRTGFGLVVIAIAELVYQFMELIERTGGVGEAFTLLGEIAGGVWEGIKTSAASIAPALGTVWEQVKAGFFSMLEAISQRWANFLHNMADDLAAIPLMEDVSLQVRGSAVRAGSQFYEFGAAAETARGQAEALRQEAGALATEGFGAAADALARLNGVAAGGGQFGPGGQAWSDGALAMLPGQETDNGNGNNGSGALIPGTGGGGGEQNAFETAIQAANDNVALLEAQAAALSMNEEAALRFTAATDLLRAAQEAGVPITSDVIDQINALAGASAQAEMALTGAQLAVQDPTPWQIAAEEIAALDAALAAGVISWEQYGDAVRRSQLSAASTTLGAVGQITGALSQAFEANKAFAVANAVVNTAEGITKALSLPFPMNWLQATAVGISGAAQIATIMSASPGGGAGVRPPSGGAAATMQNAPQRERAEREPDRLDVTIQGLDRSAMYSGETLERFIEALEERSGDGRILNIKVA